MVPSKASTKIPAGDPSYPDHCRWCRRSGRITITLMSREWIHYPTTVAPAEPGTVVAYYRCRQCEAQWTCGWADGGIDRTPSGKVPPVLGDVLASRPTEAERRGARSRPRG